MSSSFTFRYKSSQKEVNWSKLKKPIYLSKRGSRFSDWAATWARYLISKVSWLAQSSIHLMSLLVSSQTSVVFQVRHELPRRVFACCSFIVKHDYKVTIYLLPHILLYMLLGCTPAEQQEVSTRAKLFFFFFFVVVFMWSNVAVPPR